MSPLRLLSAAALPSTLAVVACSPVTRTFTGTGGDTTTTSSTTQSTSSSTSTTSTTSTTTSTPTGTCNLAGGAFKILDTATLFPGANLDDKAFLVADPGVNHPMLHLVMNNTAKGQIIIQSLSSDATKTVVNRTSFGTATAPFQAVSGWTNTSGQLLVQVTGTKGVGQLAFPADPFAGVLSTPSPTESDYPTPSDCLSPNHVGRALVVQNGSGAHYVTSCELGTTSASVWIGSSAGTPGKIGTGAQTDITTNPKVYGFAAGTNLVGFSPPQGGIAGVYAYGPDGAVTMPAGLPLVPGETGIVLATAPVADDVGNDSLAIFAASVSSDMTMGSLWSGKAKASDFATLIATPNKLLQQYLPPTDITTVGPFQRVTSDMTYFYGAGPSSTNAVNFFWFLRDGTPLVTELQAYTSSNTIVAAAAGPLGGGSVLVVWIEKDTASPPNFTINGQKISCMQN